MTNEEAIRVLNVAKAECEWNAPLDYQTAFDMAIKALKAQLSNTSEIQNSSNLISRQDALDEWNRLSERGRTEFDQVLMMLPSTQPEPSTEIQEILEYLDTTLHPIVSPDNWYVYAELHDMVNRLPSVQPEIIHCKDCKHHHYEKDIPYCDRIDYGYGWKDNDYCSRPERRTDG